MIMGLGIAYSDKKVGMITRGTLQEITDIVADWVSKTGIQEPDFLDITEFYDYDEMELGQLILFKDGKCVVPVVSTMTQVVFGGVDLE